MAKTLTILFPTPGSNSAQPVDWVLLVVSRSLSSHPKSLEAGRERSQQSLLLYSLEIHIPSALRARPESPVAGTPLRHQALDFGGFDEIRRPTSGPNIPQSAARLDRRFECRRPLTPDSHRE